MVSRNEGDAAVGLGAVGKGVDGGDLVDGAKVTSSDALGLVHKCYLFKNLNVVLC